MLLTCHGNHHPGLLQRHPHGERGPLRYPTVLNHSEAVEAGEANVTREAASPISTFTPH